MHPEPTNAAAAVAPAPGQSGSGAADSAIPDLMAEVFDAAPPAERRQLLEALMRPLGVLSLFGIASGVFANIRMRHGWQKSNIQLEDIQDVRAVQVSELVDHVQQVSVETVDGLAQMLTASPAMSATAAAAMLVTLLVQRANARQSGVKSGAASSRIS